MIYGTISNEQSCLLSSIYMYCVQHFVPLVSIVIAAFKTTYFEFKCLPSQALGER